MSTQDIVEKFRQEARLEGGRERAVHDLLAVYRARFGEPPRDVAMAIQGARDEAVLDKWLQLVATHSAVAGAPRAGAGGVCFAADGSGAGVRARRSSAR